MKNRIIIAGLGLVALTFLGAGCAGTEVAETTNSSAEVKNLNAEVNSNTQIETVNSNKNGETIVDTSEEDAEETDDSEIDTSESTWLTYNDNKLGLSLEHPDSWFTEIENREEIRFVIKDYEKREIGGPPAAMKITISNEVSILTDCTEKRSRYLGSIEELERCMDSSDNCDEVLLSCEENKTPQGLTAHYEHTYSPYEGAGDIFLLRLGNNKETVLITIYGNGIDSPDERERKNIATGVLESIVYQGNKIDIEFK